MLQVQNRHFYDRIKIVFVLNRLKTFSEYIQVPLSIKKSRKYLIIYMKFSRHVNFAILRLVYFATLKFRDFSKILCFKSLQFRVLSDTLSPGHHFFPWQGYVTSNSCVNWFQEHRKLDLETFTSSKLSPLFTSFWTYKLFVMHSGVISSFFLD